jgi:hypothetical protein
VEQGTKSGSPGVCVREMSPGVTRLVTNLNNKTGYQQVLLPGKSRAIDLIPGLTTMVSDSGARLGVSNLRAYSLVRLVKSSHQV